LIEIAGGNADMKKRKRMAGRLFSAFMAAILTVMLVPAAGLTFTSHAEEANEAYESAEDDASTADFEWGVNNSAPENDVEAESEPATVPETENVLGAEGEPVTESGPESEPATDPATVPETEGDPAVQPGPEDAPTTVPETEGSPAAEPVQPEVAQPESDEFPEEALDSLEDQKGMDMPILLGAGEAEITDFSGLWDAVAAANGTKEDPTVINLSGTIEVTANLSVNDKHIRLTGGTLTCSGVKAHMFTISGGGSLTLENITLDGTEHPQDYNLIRIDQGELILNTGAILENNCDSAVYMRGASTLTMNDGEIRNNSDMRSNGCGAAIFTPDISSFEPTPTIYINGGKISGNSVGGNGGAIYLTNYCDLNISGGEISGNSSAGSGGAVYINTTTTGNRAAICITGGSIQDNQAGEEKSGNNIYTRRNIELGPDADIPDGIYLYYLSGESRKLLLTGTPKNTIGLEASGSSANWFSVVKMKDDTAVSKETFEKIVMKDPSQSLVLGDDGTIRIGTAKGSGYPLDLTYVVWSGNGGTDNGTVGSQSGEGWEWDADTLTLKITEDFQAVSSGIETGLSLPKGNVTIEIAEGRTLTVESPDWYALTCLGNLTIRGKGTIATISGGGFTGGILSNGSMEVQDTTLKLGGDSYYFLHAEENLSLKNSDVSVVSTISNRQGTPISYYGITGTETFTAENCRINVEMTMDETCISSDKEANVCGIVTGYGDIILSGSEVNVSTTNRSPDESSYNYGIVSYGGNVSVTEDSQVTVTTVGSGEAIAFVAFEKAIVENSLIRATAAGSETDGFALEMISYGGFELTGVEVIEGKQYKIGAGEDYEEDITSSAFDPDNADSYPQGGTSVIGPVVTGITLDRQALVMSVGGKETLKAIITPPNAAIQDVVWKSGDSSVAMVDENGNVTAVSTGTVTITATTRDGGHTASCTVTVERKKAVITADNKTKRYGDEDSELTFTVSGLDKTDKLTGIVLKRTEGEQAGEYTITASCPDGVNPDYDLTFKEGKLTIAPRDIADASVELGGSLIADGGIQTQRIQKVTVKNSGGKEMEVTYTVTGNQGTEPGVHTMTITGTGNFTGTITKNFVIAPAKNDQLETDENDNVVIGQGIIGVQVQCDENVPLTECRTKKGELIAMLLKNGDLTAEELSMVSTGAELEVILKVSDASDTITDISKEQIAKAAKDYTIGRYIDICLFKQIISNGQNGPMVPISRTSKSIQISIKVPDDLLNHDRSKTRTFCIIRNHERNAQMLSTSYEKNENALIFETDCFSDYAIAYKDTEHKSSHRSKGSNGTAEPANTAVGAVASAHTGDNSSPWLWLMGILSACCGGIGILLCGRRKRS